MRILLATTRYPWPPRRGDQVRSVQWLAFLAGEHEVTLLTPAPGPGAPAPPADLGVRLETYRQDRAAGLAGGALRALSLGLPFQSALFYQPDLARSLRALAPAADLAILQLARLAIHLPDFGSTPLLVDLIDSLALSFRKRAAVDRPWRRPLLRLEARRLEAWERRLAERAGRVTVVCERDRQALADRLQPRLTARLAVVPLALAEPVTSPTPVSGAPALSPGDGPVLALTGNLGYFVNVDAATWWLGEAWPALRQARPDLRVVVAGARPAPRLARAVAEAGPGVTLTADPRDLGAILAQATLSLAPLRCGAGVPVKILEAWAAGVPVVATAWAAAGTSGRPGEDFCVLDEDPAEWVRAVLSLVDDPAARRRLADSGRRRLTSDYSPAAARRQLLAEVAQAVATSGMVSA